MPMSHDFDAIVIGAGHNDAMRVSKDLRKRR